MDTHESRPHIRLTDASPRSSRETIVPNDLEIACRRMRHLAPWNVRPIPMMHSVAGKPDRPITAGQRERSKRLAMKVLAVQISQASATSALH